MDVIVAYHITCAQGGISRHGEQDSRGQVAQRSRRGRALFVAEVADSSGDCVSAGAAPARELTFVLDEVDQHVVAEGLGRGEECPAAVDLGELFDERLE
jgi:hypothetical protein